MDENAIHEWLIKCFGPVQGEQAWQQLQSLPSGLRDQLFAQNAGQLPDPDEVKQMMSMFSMGGLNSMSEMKSTVESGPINVKLAKMLAHQRANSDEAQTQVSATDGERVRRAMSEANLWLDSACNFNPASGEPEVLTREGWVDATLDQWISFASPVAESMNKALASVISERLGGLFGDGAITGMFAGPVPIPIPDNLNDPGQLMTLLGNTAFAMQLGAAAGDLSQRVYGGFDQGIALMKNPAGALVAQNALEYAKTLNGEKSPHHTNEAKDSTVEDALTDELLKEYDKKEEQHPSGEAPSDQELDEQLASISEQAETIPEEEVITYLALQEVAHARLYASVPWLMPRFDALISKYARGITIDLDAMEEQLRDVTSMDPESFSNAVNLAKVAISNSPEQQEALASIESLLALVEGWVDCVVWRAGMAHLPHIEQLREMMRRERALGGPASQTFSHLLGMELRPKRMREAANLWEMVTLADGIEARDAKWSHPDQLPTFTDENKTQASSETKSASSSVDWDAELSKLLDGDEGAADKGNSGDLPTPDDGNDSDQKA